MVKLFKAVLFGYRFRKAVRTADKRKAQTGKKQFVINLCGRPVCVSKEHIRRLVSEGVYRPDVKVADIARVAIYKTR